MLTHGDSAENTQISDLRQKTDRLRRPLPHLYFPVWQALFLSPKILQRTGDPLFQGPFWKIGT